MRKLLKSLNVDVGTVKVLLARRRRLFTGTPGRRVTPRKDRREMESLCRLTNPQVQDDWKR